jgi:DNA polymerase alpha subunit B
MGSIREEIQAQFKSSVASDEKLVEERTCLDWIKFPIEPFLPVISICQIYNLSPEHLFYKWEAINFNSSTTHSAMSSFSMDSVIALKALLQRELAKESGKKAQRAVPAGKAAVVNRSRLPANMARVMNTGAKAGVIQVKEEQSGAGPSTVTFRGPKLDASSQRDRACECRFMAFL